MERFIVDETESFCYKGELPVSEEDAWDMVIEKWETIVDMGEEIGYVYNWNSIGTCGFCLLYYRSRCVGCPIYDHTGKMYCRGTPFEDWSDAIEGRNTGTEIVSAAQNELQFLIDLRYGQEERK